MKSMWGTQILLGIIGLSSGMVVSAGLFSFIIGLGIISKFADRTNTAGSILMYENAIILGGVLGNIFLLYQLKIPILAFMLPIFGLASGIFVGCWAMSIAEVINIFPILIRRVKLVKGIKYLVLCVAIGKCIGAILLFTQGWGK